MQIGTFHEFQATRLYRLSGSNRETWPQRSDHFSDTWRAFRWRASVSIWIRFSCASLKVICNKIPLFKQDYAYGI